MRLELGLGLGEFANRGPTPPVYDLVNFEADVAAFQFACQRAVVRDTGTPANDHDGDCSILTVTRATGEGHFNEYGLFVWDATNDTLRFDHDPATVSASTTSVTIGTATKAFITDGAYTFVAGQTVQATDNASASNFIRGKVVAYDSTSFRLSIIPEVTGGSGTKADWTIIRCLGILTEAQQTNLLTYSDALDNAAWGKENGTISADATTAPDGNSTADAVIESSATGEHDVRRINFTVTNGAVHTQSAFFKRGTGSRDAFLRTQGINGNNYLTTVDLDDGSILSSDATDAGVEVLPDGWFRIWHTVPAEATDSTVTQIKFGLAQGTTINYAGDNTSSVYIWGCQFVQGAYRGSYIPTVASQVTRNADTVDMALAEFPWNSGTGTLEINGSSATAEDDGTYLEISDIASTESINWIETLTWVPS